MTQKDILNRCHFVGKYLFEVRNEDTGKTVIKGVFSVFLVLIFCLKMGKCDLKTSNLFIIEHIIISENQIAIKSVGQPFRVF